MESPHPPFFIMGCPRSGTTLVSRMLDSHPRLAVYHETHYYPLFRPHLHRYGDLRTPANLARFIDDVRAQIQLEGIEPPAYADFQRALVAPTFAGVLATLLHLYARAEGKVRGGDKTPAHFAYLPEISAAFPDSPLIFLMRDPRDTVLSMQKAFGLRTDDAAHQWRHAFLRLREAARPLLMVRYEELVRDPVAHAERLCAHLGERYEPGMMRFFDRTPDRWRAIAHLTLGKIAGPVDAGSVGAYRQQMSAGDVRLVEAICAEGMEAMGYAFDGPRPAAAPPPRQVGSLRVAWERVRYLGLKRERWRRALFRWRRLVRLYARSLLMRGPLSAS